MAQPSRVTAATVRERGTGALSADSLAQARGSNDCLCRAWLKASAFVVGLQPLDEQSKAEP
jgi:hypothetical protein